MSNKYLLSIYSSYKHAQKLLKLVEDLGWEFDRMSTSGQETLIEIFEMVDIKQLPQNRLEATKRLFKKRSKNEYR